MLTATPSRIGATAEMAVAAALHHAGWEVFVPLFAADSRVDLVARRSHRLLSVQCKTSRLTGGCVVFRTCSNTGNSPLDYRGEIDAFGVFSPERSEVYLVPVADVAIRRGYLRVEPAKNGQRAGIRMAEDYVIGPS